MSDDAPAQPATDRRMLEALICPQTHATLTYDAEAQELISKPAGLAFPIRGGIPILLVDEARALDDCTTEPPCGMRVPEPRIDGPRYGDPSLVQQRFIPSKPAKDTSDAPNPTQSPCRRATGAPL